MYLFFFLHVFIFHDKFISKVSVYFISHLSGCQISETLENITYRKTKCQQLFENLIDLWTKCFYFEIINQFNHQFSRIIKQQTSKRNKERNETFQRLLFKTNRNFGKMLERGKTSKQKTSLVDEVRSMIK